MDAEAKAEVEWLIELVSKIRTTRNELNVPASAMLVSNVRDATESTVRRIKCHYDALKRLARTHISDEYMPPISHAAFAIEGGDFLVAKGDVQVVVAEATYTIPLEGIIDIAAEKARLTKALETSTKEAKSLEGRLSNPAFVEKAKPEAVDKARADLAQHAAEAERLALALARLG